jgi:hypothetical protein
MISVSCGGLGGSHLLVKGTAIALWFTNGDPISIHALAATAYQIIHTVTKKRTPNRRTFLFDCAIVGAQRPIWWV